MPSTRKPSSSVASSSPASLPSFPSPPQAVIRRASSDDLSQPLKSISWMGSVALVTNNITGAAMLDFPHLFDSAGLIPTIACVTLAYVLTSMAGTMLADTISRIPGNRHFQREVEFSDAFRYFLGKSWFQVTQLAYFLCLFGQNIVAIVSTAQATDSFLASFVLGRTYGLRVAPAPMSFVAWDESFCEGDSAEDATVCVPFENQGEDALIISMGYLIIMVLLLPLGLWNLRETIAAQIAAFVALFVLTLEFIVSYGIHGLSVQNLTWVGSDYTALVGVVLFNFSFLVTVPAWLNEKKPSVNVSSTIWTSTSISSGMYIVFGLIGAMSHLHSPENALSTLSSSKVTPFTRVCACLFAVFIIGLGVPVFCVMMHHNLHSGGILPGPAALFVGAILPWVVSWLFYQGQAAISLLNWAGLILNGFVAFIAPLVLSYKATRVSQFHHIVSAVKSERARSGSFGNVAEGDPWDGVSDGAQAQRSHSQSQSQQQQQTPPRNVNGLDDTDEYGRTRLTPDEIAWLSVTPHPIHNRNPALSFSQDSRESGGSVGGGHGAGEEQTSAAGSPLAGSAINSTVTTYGSVQTGPEPGPGPSRGPYQDQDGENQPSSGCGEPEVWPTPPRVVHTLETPQPRERWAAASAAAAAAGASSPSSAAADDIDVDEESQAVNDTGNATHNGHQPRSEDTEDGADPAQEQEQQPGPHALQQSPERRGMFQRLTDRLRGYQQVEQGENLSLLAEKPQPPAEQHSAGGIAPGAAATAAPAAAFAASEDSSPPPSLERRSDVEGSFSIRLSSDEDSSIRMPSTDDEPAPRTSSSDAMTSSTPKGSPPSVVVSDDVLAKRVRFGSAEVTAPTTEELPNVALLNAGHRSFGRSRSSVTALPGDLQQHQHRVALVLLVVITTMIVATLILDIITGTANGA